MAVSSRPPPSSAVPKQGGSGPYIIGVLVLGGLAAALLLSKKCGKEEPTTTQVTTVTATVTQPPPPVDAPPPPPKIDELPDAGSDAGAVAKTTTSGGGPGPGACANCKGEASPALQSAVRSAAGAAQGCYQRALRTSEVAGKMSVNVTVAQNGSVCGVGIGNDTTGSNEVKSCVLGKFQGRSFPPPTGGCMTLVVPLNFTIKQ